AHHRFTHGLGMLLYIIRYKGVMLKCIFQALADQPVYFLKQFLSQILFYCNAPQRHRYLHLILPAGTKIHYLMEPFVPVSKPVFMNDNTQIRFLFRNHIFYFMENSEGFITGLRVSKAEQQVRSSMNAGQYN